MNVIPSLPGRLEVVVPLPQTTGMDINVALTHGRATPPALVMWRMVCTLPFLGYQPGDCISLMGDNGSYILPGTKWENGSQLGFILNSTSPVWTNHKTTGTLTVVPTPLWRYAQLKVTAIW
jgi:hypothetical protein